MASRNHVENASQQRLPLGRGFHLGIDVQRIIDALTSLLTAPQQLHTEPNHELIASFTRRSQSLRLLEMIRETAPSLMPA